MDGILLFLFSSCWRIIITWFKIHVVCYIVFIERSLSLFTGSVQWVSWSGTGYCMFRLLAKIRFFAYPDFIGLLTVWTAKNKQIKKSDFIYDFITFHLTFGGGFEMRFHSDFYRRISVWMIWLFKIEFQIVFFSSILKRHTRTFFFILWKVLFKDFYVYFLSPLYLFFTSCV